MGCWSGLGICICWGVILIVKRTIETAVDLVKIHLTPEVGDAHGRQSVTILAAIDEGYAGSSTDKFVPAQPRFSSGQKSDKV